MQLVEPVPAFVALLEELIDFFLRDQIVRQAISKLSFHNAIAASLGREVIQRRLGRKRLWVGFEPVPRVFTSVGVTVVSRISISFPCHASSGSSSPPS